jgi:cell division septal protein FtsQ
LVRVLVGLAVLAVLALLTWVIGYSSLLTADQVRIDGVDGPLARQVQEAADVPLGLQLARVDTDAVAQRVQSVPAVATATVSRGWPRTVVIAVEPRVPLASVSGEEGWYRVDVDGVLFSPSAEPAADLPVLAAPADVAGEQARAAGVGVVAALPSRVLRQVARIEAPSPLAVRLVLRDGRVVIWGSAQDAELKADVLDVLLETPATQYDVSVPDRPTLRPS